MRQWFGLGGDVWTFTWDICLHFDELWCHVMSRHLPDIGDICKMSIGDICRYIAVTTHFGIFFSTQPRFRQKCQMSNDMSRRKKEIQDSFPAWCHKSECSLLLRRSLEDQWLLNFDLVQVWPILGIFFSTQPRFRQKCQMSNDMSRHLLAF